MLKTDMTEQRIIIFDGVCNFCNGAVNFIIRHDPDSKFSFTTMQSKLARDFTHRYNIDNVGIDTFLLIKDGKCFIWTNAALEIASELEGSWHLFGLFRIVPRPVRDYFYRLFARNRYALFGRTDECMIPTQNVRSRFVDL